VSRFPYNDEFEVHRTLPASGTAKDEILAMMGEIAARENVVWEGGHCSGTMYCGDHDHYDFLNEAFANFSYVNTLQRDMCPSATKFEAEVIAMTLDMLGASSLEGSRPGGLVTSGGSSSIAHAVLAYREGNPDIARANIIKPETAHPAFSKAGHLFGVDMKIAPVDSLTLQVDLDWVASNVDANTVAIIGSAPNYGYGTVDPIRELGAIALEHDIGLHVDGCLGGFLLPFGR
jgi:glutamate/tyrosine decarboxylase-like PLP-dependent enzyme